MLAYRRRGTFKLSSINSAVCNPRYVSIPENYCIDLDYTYTTYITKVASLTSLRRNGKSVMNEQEAFPSNIVY